MMRFDFRALLVMLMINPTSLLGCSCSLKNEELTLGEYFGYDEICLVRVINEGNTYESDLGMSRYWAKVELIKSFKGNRDVDTIWSDYSSCSRSLFPGNEYIYYGYEDWEKPFVGHCSRTKSINDGFYGKYNQELNFLEKMSYPLVDIEELIYSNGQKIGKGKLIDKKCHGDWEFYFPDGNIMENGRFENGIKDGNWMESYRMYCCNDSTAPIRKETGNYQHGVRIGKWEIHTYDPISRKSWDRIKEYDLNPPQKSGH